MLMQAGTRKERLQERKEMEQDKKEGDAFGKVTGIGMPRCMNEKGGRSRPLPLLPGKWLSPGHHMELCVAMDVPVLNTLPHIDEEDFDLGLRPAQDHQRLVRPTRQRLEPVGLAPRADIAQMRIRRPWIRGQLGLATLYINKSQIIHPLGHTGSNPKLPGRV